MKKSASAPKQEPEEAEISSQGLYIDENGSFKEVNPKMSFTQFVKTYFLGNEISEHHKEIIEKLVEVAGAPNHFIIQGVHPINWYKNISLMRHTLEAVINGENCAVATHNPEKYTELMKSFFNADVELKELSENVYSIKLSESKD